MGRLTLLLSKHFTCSFNHAPNRCIRSLLPQKLIFIQQVFDKISYFRNLMKTLGRAATRREVSEDDVVMLIIFLNVRLPVASRSLKLFSTIMRVGIESTPVGCFVMKNSNLNILNKLQFEHSNSQSPEDIRVKVTRSSVSSADLFPQIDSRTENISVYFSETFRYYRN